MNFIEKAVGRNLLSYIALAGLSFSIHKGLYLLHVLYAGFITLKPSSRVTYRHIRDEMGNLIL